MKKEAAIREPLFHIVKRNTMRFWKRMVVRVLAVLAALIVSSLFSVVFAGVEPITLISSMVDGNFGSMTRIWKLCKDMVLLLGIALALTPAFKMRFWNIGGEGQTLVGALGAICCVMYFGGDLPEYLLIPFMLITALVSGAIWALIPAIFKAFCNTNETLFTLMMNYIAMQLVKYMLLIWVPTGNALPEQAHGHLNFFPGWDYGDEFTVISILLAVTALLYVYLRYSKQGYEISVVGESENTAKYIGINVKKVVIRTMLLSGLLCGLVGFLIVSVFNHSITADAIGGMGFTAIMVSWLAKFNPAIMIGTSFLITFLEQGADQLVSDLSFTEVETFLNRGVESSNISYGISSDFPNVLVGIILFFIVGCEFFINYKIIFKSKKAEKGEDKK